VTECTARRHGTGSAARKYGCRCPEAVAARRAQRGPRVRSRNGRGRIEREAVEERIRLTAVLTRAGLSANAIAVQLGVDCRSVQRYRHRIKQAA
jgi:hypothetical protein